MRRSALNVAEAKAHFSELTNRVADGAEEIVVTKRGKPVARVRRAHERINNGLALVQGWLGKRDPFFSTIAEIERHRGTRVLRVVGRIRA